MALNVIHVRFHLTAAIWVLLSRERISSGKISSELDFGLDCDAKSWLTLILYIPLIERERTVGSSLYTESRVYGDAGLRAITQKWYIAKGFEAWNINSRTARHTQSTMHATVWRMVKGWFHRAYFAVCSKERTNAMYFHLLLLLWLLLLLYHTSTRDSQPSLSCTEQKGNKSKSKTNISSSNNSSTRSSNSSSRERSKTERSKAEQCKVKQQWHTIIQYHGLWTLQMIVSPANVEMFAYIVSGRRSQSLSNRWGISYQHGCVICSTAFYLCMHCFTF